MNTIKSGRRITIKDIAEQLGISPSTVSRALNDSPNISQSTKLRVKEKARELGYVKSQNAKALKTKKTMTVGIIVSDIKNPFFLDFLDGVEKILFPRKYRILLSTSNEDVNKEKVYLRWLMEHGVDGIMVSPAFDTDGSTNVKLLRKIKRYGVPIVLYDRIFEGYEGEFDSVTIDNEGAILKAMRYLKNMGHSRIGIILADTRIYTVKRRYEGYLEGCRVFGLECGEKSVLHLKQPFDEESCEEVTRFLKNSNFTAVIATNHEVTKMIYKGLKILGKRIPDDVSVVGFDDVDENEFFDPPVTVIKQPVLYMGKAAATLLLGRIDGEVGKVQNMVLTAELIERKSVKNLTPNLS